MTTRKIKIMRGIGIIGSGVEDSAFGYLPSLTKTVFEI